MYSGEYDVCGAVCASTPGKLKILPDHGGNRTRNLWGHILGILSRDLWDHIISKELDSVPKYTHSKRLDLGVQLVEHWD